MKTSVSRGEICSLSDEYGGPYPYANGGYHPYGPHMPWAVTVAGKTVKAQAAAATAAAITGRVGLTQVLPGRCGATAQRSCRDEGAENLQKFRDCRVLRLICRRETTRSVSETVDATQMSQRVFT